MESQRCAIYGLTDLRQHAAAAALERGASHGHGGILSRMQGFLRAPGVGDTRKRRAAGLLAAVIGLLAALLFAAPALASDPAPASGVPTRAGEPRPGDRVFCTPLGCRSPAPGSWSHAAAFGAAVLAARLARSRGAPEARRAGKRALPADDPQAGPGERGRTHAGEPCR